jgi:hypothetical protein
MTASTDFDRALREWFETETTRAPEAPILAALEHARRHPRRGDPFRRLRPDPMPARARAAVGRPVLVLVALGLLLAAAVGFAVVGSPRPAVVPPAPTSPASAPATATPTPPPTLGPDPVPFTVPIETGTAAVIRVTIEDHSRLLAGARSGAPVGGGSVLIGAVRVENEDATTLRLTWTDAVCSSDHRLVIDDPGTTMTFERPPCRGDATALDRVLVLEFETPIDASDVRVTVVDLDPPG